MSSRIARCVSPWRVGAVAVLAALCALAVFASYNTSQPRAAEVPSVPNGVTAIALAGKAGLAWQPANNATSYTVYRGTTIGAITTQVATGVTTTTWADTSVTTGTKYFYAVRAVSSAGTSASSAPAQVTILAKSCSTGNAIVQENCFTGTTAWKAPAGTGAFNDGIEGYATASSVNAGDSVDLKVQAMYNVPYRVEIYRSGWYGGTQGRLISVIPGLSGVLPPPCFSDPTGTGVSDCSSWSPAATISTRSDWPSGVYLIKLVRDDNGNYSEFPLVVRNDGSSSDLLYHVPTFTYQAYNSFNGKSLYTGLSNPPNTISGASRAVKVSQDRPYSLGISGPAAHDYYPRADVGMVSFLERQGYNTTYVASDDVALNGGQLLNHKVFMTGTHDEYWTQSMLDAVTAARNAGVSIFVQGANTAYWRVRLEPSTVSGKANRVMVAYKTVEGGPVDPVSSTSTFRDPAGPNQPENALLGQMYVGQNIQTGFGLQVSAAQGQNRVWRHTSLATMAAGTTTTVGSELVGWEWDSRVDNGLEPAGVTTVAATPVTGDISVGNGTGTVPGAATQNSTIYTAASGAVVFSTGTMNWQRGLANNADNVGEPNSIIQQATINVLADMNARPTSISSGLVIDPSTPPTVTSTVPANNATGVTLSSQLKVVYDQQLDPSTVSGSDYSLTSSGGTSIPLTASVDNATKTVTLTPTQAMNSNTGYTARALTSVATWDGTAPTAVKTWTFSTGAGTPPVVTSRNPNAGATNVPTDANVTATFDRALTASTVTTSTVQLKATSGGATVAGSVSYNSTTRTVTFNPTARLSQSTGYTLTLTTGIRASDGVAVAANITSTFTTGTEVTVASRFPGASATGIAPAAQIRATFSRAVDPATVTSANVRLRGLFGFTVSTTLAFDPTTQTVRLTPTSSMSTNTTYTVEISGAVRGSDGGPMTATSWTFQTASSTPPAPTASGLVPAASATNVLASTAVSATFSVALDAATVSNQTVTLAPTAGGAAVAATVGYDAPSQTITLTPSASLAADTSYRATISTGVRSAVGQPLAATVTWTFVTGKCPCFTMGGLTPTSTNMPVQDFRPGPGPFTYELGTKFTVTEATQLTAIRFYKSNGEGGTHVGRVWSTSGTQLRSVTFSGETASGWQQQALGSPLTLTPGTVYVVSVNANDFYSKTSGGLSAPLTNGPVETVADGNNGVFNGTAGQFPNDSWQNSNYFVDPVVSYAAGAVNTPSVSTVTPTSGATGVATSTTVKATFATAMTASTITSSTFTLKNEVNDPVAASVTYDSATRTATLTPTASLPAGHAYTATLSTGVESNDGTPLAEPYSWTFAVGSPTAPTVSSVSPSNGATGVAVGSDATVTFSTAMDASTITATNVKLVSSTGATVPASVTYDSATRIATINPTGSLTSGATYTGQVTTGVKSSGGVALPNEFNWSFTTAGCPCQLYDDTPITPQFANLDTSNGRGAGAFTLELGIKVQVTAAANLTAIRFMKDPNETGTHVGRVWNSAGTLLASVTFTGESASGWQTQALSTPLALTPGETYVVSYGANAKFGMTAQGLATARTSGPLQSVADGQNGVYGDAAGTFPTQSWGSSSYFVDAVVQ